MATLDKTTYEGKYNNASTGLFKDNTTHDIGADDGRSLVTDTKDSFLNFTDDVIDEDTMASNLATKVPTQQSVKAYVDAQVGAGGTSIPYGITVGTDAYTIDASPSVTSYTDGDLFLVECATTSTGPVTFDFDSVGVIKAFATPEHQMGDGELTTGRYYLFAYDDALDGGLGGVVLANESVQGRVYLSPNSFDASSGAIPSGIGSGPSGAIKHGDAFRVGTAGTVGGVILAAADLLIAEVDAPAAIGSYSILSGLVPTDAKLALKANLLSPTFTGIPAAPTASPADNSTQIATTAYVDAATGTVNASATVKGVLEVATLAEIVAGTDTGATGALLSVLPSQLGGTRTTDGSSGNASVQADHLGYVICDSATPFNFTLDALIAKTKLTVVNYGVGTVTFVNGSGVALFGDATLPGANGTSFPGVLINYDLTNVPRIITGAAGIDVIGVHDQFVSAFQMWPKTTAGCSALTKSEIATSLFNIQTLDFDQTTEEGCQFQIVLPRKWNIGGVNARVYWTASAGTAAQTVQWLLNGYAYSNDDALTSAFGSTTQCPDALIATNDLHITDVVSGPTLGGTPASADFLAFQIRRDVANDNLAADAKLLGISIRYIATAAIDE